MNRSPIQLKPLPEPRLEILNLIDILITLVAFFMLTSTFIINQPHQALGIDLPQVRHEASPTQAAARLVLELHKDRQLFYHNRTITHDNLKAIFQQQPRDTVVVIKADKDCRYSWIVELLDTAAGYQLKKVALEVRKQ